MKNFKDIVIGVCAIFGFTAILTGFTNEETSIVQQYEFEIVTVVESVVPKGLGRSRMLAKTEIVDYNLSGTDCVERMIYFQNENLSCHFQKETE